MTIFLRSDLRKSEIRKDSVIDPLCEKSGIICHESGIARIRYEAELQQRCRHGRRAQDIERRAQGDTAVWQSRRIMQTDKYIFRERKRRRRAAVYKSLASRRRRYLGSK